MSCDGQKEPGFETKLKKEKEKKKKGSRVQKQVQTVIIPFG